MHASGVANILFHPFPHTSVPKSDRQPKDSRAIPAYAELYRRGQTDLFKLIFFTLKGQNCPLYQTMHSEGAMETILELLQLF